jgi:hypothetical protein
MLHDAGFRAGFVGRESLAGGESLAGTDGRGGSARGEQPPRAGQQQRGER